MFNKLAGRSKRGKSGRSKKDYPYLDAAGIEAEEFYIPARDVEGGKERVYAWIQPSHARQIGVYGSPGSPYPYENGADLVRHAIKRHLEWLRDSVPTPVRSIMSQAALIEQISRDADYQLRFEETFKTMSATVGRFMSSNNLNEARRYLALCAASVRDMPSGSWKERYIKQFTDQFGPYLKVTKQGDLIQSLNDAPEPVFLPTASGDES